MLLLFDWIDGMVLALATGCWKKKKKRSKPTRCKR